MPSKTILDCDKTLQKVWNHVLLELRRGKLDYHLQIIHSHIAPEEQRELFHIGRNGLGELIGDASRTVTDYDGTERVTLFNEYPSKAVRFKILTPQNQECWPPVVYQIIGEVCHKAGVGFTAPDVIHRL